MFGGNDEETANTFNEFPLDGNNQPHVSIHGQQKESLFKEQEHSNEQQMGDGNDEELADYVHDTRKGAVAIAPAAAASTTGDNVDDEYQQEYIHVGDESKFHDNYYSSNGSDGELCFLRDTLSTYRNHWKGQFNRKYKYWIADGCYISYQFRDHDIRTVYN